MQSSIFSFYRQFYPKLWKNLKVRRQILAYNSITTKIYNLDDTYELFVRIFDHYLEEADQILDLISQSGLDRKKKYLEIGGGLGLVYGFLKHFGYKIFSCEPTLAGYDNVFDIGKQILKLIKVSDSGWRPYRADQVDQFKTKFDVIFSNNVLEHIQDLRGNIQVLESVMSPAGEMIHNTVNYWLPYDPHYRILLVPFFPRLTHYFIPKLKKALLWQELNFINPWKIYWLSRGLNLGVKYFPNRLSETIKRMEVKSEFSRRHRRWQRYLSFIKLLVKFPPIFQTPLAFTLKKKD